MEKNKYEGTQTEQNLKDAFSGESEARNKYTLSAMSPGGAAGGSCPS